MNSLPMEASSDHLEAAAILKDVSQQSDIFDSQSQAASILMNVGQGKEVTRVEMDEGVKELLMNIDDSGKVYPVADNTMQTELNKPEAVQQTFEMSESASAEPVTEHQQFKVMASDGQYHMITLAGVEEKVDENGVVQTNTIIQVDSPGGETETITVSGLTENYSLESLAQIAEIVVNSKDNTSSTVTLPEDSVITQEDVVESAIQELESPYIAMKDIDKVGQMEGMEVVQTIAVDTPQGSQNLVSLAQIAELVINQGTLDIESQGSVQQSQIQNTLNHPLGLQNLYPNAESRKLPTSHAKTKPRYYTVPSVKDNLQAMETVISERLGNENQSNYTTTILPDARRNPPQRSSPGKNIFSKIKSDNGECYMVVLPDADPLNPTQLRNIINNYIADPKAGESKPILRKPKTYSAGSQTVQSRFSHKYFHTWAYPRTKHMTIPGTSYVLVKPDSEDTGHVSESDAANESATRTIATETSVEVTAMNTSVPKASTDTEMTKQTNEDKDLPVQVKTEPVEDSTSTKADSGTLDNCGHEVAKARSSDAPKPETSTVTVQTDVTSNCFITFSPEDLRSLRRRPRTYRNRRKYLDDPKDSGTAADVKHTPFLKKKSLIDTENAFYICGMCKQKYKSADELKKHAKCHKPKKTTCPTCNKKCANLKVLSDHVISHTKCKTFKCCVCKSDTVFTSPASFKEHVKEHLLKQYFVCGSCNQKFAHIANLRVHMRVHTGEKPFKCDLCPIGFTQKASLEAHVASFHNKEKPFKCNDCDISFARKTDLRIHKRKHTGERPYNCEICGNTFTSNSGLTSHIKTHYRQRYHQCSKCDKSFHTPARLKKHIESWHEGENAFRCPACDSKCATKEALKEHMAIHEKAFPCFGCNFGTDSKQLLAKHIEKNHPEHVKKMPEMFGDKSSEEQKTSDSVAVVFKSFEVVH